MKTKRQPKIEELMNALARYEKDNGLRSIATSCKSAEGIRISAPQRKIIILVSQLYLLFKDHEFVKNNRALLRECLSLREALESKRLITIYANRGAPQAYVVGNHPGSAKLRTGH